MPLSFLPKQESGRFINRALPKYSETNDLFDQIDDIENKEKRCCLVLAVDYNI